MVCTCVVGASGCEECVVDAGVSIKAPNVCDAGGAVVAGVEVVQCSGRAGSACVSSLVVGGAEFDVAGGVHWRDVAVGCAIVCVGVGGGCWWRLRCCLCVLLIF